MATILLADDDDLLVELVTAHLSGAGHRVLVANDGRQALQMIAERRPEAVILDGMMPVFSGLEVLRQLRDDPATSGLPVMMLTARNGEEDATRYFEAGANDYLSKPFSSGELMMRLEMMLRRAARNG